MGSLLYRMDRRSLPQNYNNLHPRQSTKTRHRQPWRHSTGFQNYKALLYVCGRDKVQ